MSVLESARGRGIGSKLFERAAIRSRNTQVSMLYMHCLSRNSTMMHIAKKSGMKIEYAYGEADAYLSLTPADQSSIIAEMLQEQAAVVRLRDQAPGAPRVADVPGVHADGGRRVTTARGWRCERDQNRKGRPGPPFFVWCDRFNAAAAPSFP